MGGYAFYVWASYGIAAVLLVVNLWVPLLQGKRLRRRLRMTLQEPAALGGQEGVHPGEGRT